MLIKYKKYEYNTLLKKLKKTMFLNFFNKYIDTYLKKLNINTIEQFEYRTNKFINYYKKIDSNAKLYFHVLIDIDYKKCIGISRILVMSDLFFTIPYFVKLKKDYMIPSNIQISYLTNLYIDSDYRGKKLCIYLLQKIYKNSVKNNIKYIISEIHQDNIQSIRCNKSIGFIKTNILSYPKTYFYINKIIQ